MLRRYQYSQQHLSHNAAVEVSNHMAPTRGERAKFKSRRRNKTMQQHKSSHKSRTNPARQTLLISHSAAASHLHGRISWLTYFPQPLSVYTKNTFINFLCLLLLQQVDVEQKNHQPCKYLLFHRTRHSNAILNKSENNRLTISWRTCSSLFCAAARKPWWSPWIQPSEYGREFSARASSQGSAAQNTFIKNATAWTDKILIFRCLAKCEHKQLRVRPALKPLCVSFLVARIIPLSAVWIICGDPTKPTIILTAVAIEPLFKTLTSKSVVRGEGKGNYLVFKCASCPCPGRVWMNTPKAHAKPWRFISMLCLIDNAFYTRWRGSLQTRSFHCRALLHLWAVGAKDHHDFNVIHEDPQHTFKFSRSGCLLQEEKASLLQHSFPGTNLVAKKMSAHVKCNFTDKTGRHKPTIWLIAMI